MRKGENMNSKGLNISLVLVQIHEPNIIDNYNGMTFDMFSASETRFTA